MTANAFYTTLPGSWCLFFLALKTGCSSDKSGAENEVSHQNSLPRLPVLFRFEMQSASVPREQTRLSFS